MLKCSTSGTLLYEVYRLKVLKDRNCYISACEYGNKSNHFYLINNLMIIFQYIEGVAFEYS